MFDPSQVTFGQISSTIRDFTIVSVLVAAVWKARGVYERGVHILERMIKHMDTMEAGMNTLLTNHLHHIETDLAELRKRGDTQE
jgi:hypothetical protein